MPESYVHRIGRTARAGAAGTAISFCDNEEREYLRDIEKLIRCRLPVGQHHGDNAVSAFEPFPASAEHAPRPKSTGARAPRPQPANAKPAVAKPAATKPAGTKAFASNASLPLRTQPKATSATPTAGKKSRINKPTHGAAPRSSASGDQPLRRADGMGRVATASGGGAHHDLSHLRFLANSPAISPSRRTARAGGR